MKLSRSLLTIVAVLAPVACHSKKQDTSESLPPVAVRTVVVENKARPSSEEVVGTVRAKLRAAIEPKVSARIELRNQLPGFDHLSRGDEQRLDSCAYFWFNRGAKNQK